MFPQICGVARRHFLEIKKEILKVLSDGTLHAYGDLERKVNTNWKTIRDHCKDLEIFGAVTISESGVKVTKKGLEVLKKL